MPTSKAWVGVPRAMYAPETIHDATSPWVSAARTFQSPTPAGAPIARYATPLGARSPVNNSAALSNTPVVSRFSSPLNGNPVKNDATASTGAASSGAASVTIAPDSSFSTLRRR